ncbi:MAG: hypothetical protein HY822_15355 [Acidobacteria bacterium]|nr:hypothetical protein [Acidobacteriota bacterium]
MSFKSLLKLVLCLVCAGGAAPADTLYSTFGPGDSFDGHYVQWIGDGAQVSQPYPSRQVANRFTVPAGAEVTGYRVAISHFAPSGHGQGQGLLSLWSGDAAPATTLESDIVVDTGDGAAIIASISSVLHPNLSPGVTYWLVLSAPAGELFRWYDAVAPMPAGSERLYRDDSLASWNMVGASANAFEVSGALSGVPEPHAWLLFGSALGLTAAARVRRRAR